MLLVALTEPEIDPPERNELDEAPWPSVNVVRLPNGGIDAVIEDEKPLKLDRFGRVVVTELT